MDEQLKIHNNQMRILILGGTGFVGTNLTNYLKEKGTINKAELIIKSVGQSDVNLLHQTKVAQFIGNTSPEVVINLAAFVGGIGLNRDRPADMIYKNLIMSANVIEACRLTRVQQLISIGTVCSYPHTPKHIPFIEEDLWDGRPESTNEPYGVAKKAIGVMLEAYKKQHNLGSCYLIPTNMYGPHDDFNPNSSHVIPALIKKFIEAKSNKLDTVTIWGTGKASRDFLYVDDFSSAVYSSIGKVFDPNPINIGSGDETKIADLVTMISKEVGYTGKIVWDASKPDGQPRRQLNISKAKEIIGYAPKVLFKEGLKKSIEWYKSTLD